MHNVDTLIHARWIIPVEPEGAVYEYHSLAMRDGRILDILPTSEAGAKYRSHTVLDLDEHALVPGLVNAHTHAAMSLFRGLADDLPLMEWLNNHIWPAEGAWVSPEFVADGARLAIAEMLRGGTTCFSDMYFFPDETARVVEESGIRACVGLIVIDFPTVWAGDAAEYLHKGLEVHDRYRDHPWCAPPLRRMRRTPCPTRRWRRSACMRTSSIRPSTCTSTKRRTRSARVWLITANVPCGAWINLACSRLI